MKHGSKWLFSVLAVILAAVMLTGCGGGGGEKKAEAPKAKGPSGEIMIYTSMYPDIIDKVCKPTIQKSIPDLKVNWFQGGTEKLKTKVAGEIKANKIATDVLMVADPGYYLNLQQKGLLLNYVSPNQKDVLLDKDKDGAWSAVRICNMIIAYNESKIAKEDIPTTWSDLLDPKYKGKIAMPNPMLSGTAFVAAGALADKFGWEFFDKLKANGLKVEEGNSAIQNKLLTGEYMCAIILEENILKIQETKKEPLKVVYPKEGCILISSPICIMKSTKNPDGAKAAVDWWLSKEGQQAVTKGWMHSVRADVAPPNGAPKLETLLPNAIKVDWNKMATKEADIKNEFRTRVIDKK